jgi:Spy/CpxP family protein refolding chaperone
MKYPKFIVLLSLAMIMATAPVWAQQALPAQRPYTINEARRDFRLLNLGADEIAAIRGVLDKDARAVELARADIRECQARLARLLLDAEPDRARIEATVRQSLDAEYRIRMVQIDRSIALRSILGERRWPLLYQLSRGIGGLSRADLLRNLPERRGEDELWSTLLEMLRALQ